MKRFIFVLLLDKKKEIDLFQADICDPTSYNKHIKKISNHEVKEALIFNKKLFMENFIIPNKLKLPSFRNILEKYYT